MSDRPSRPKLWQVDPPTDTVPIVDRLRHTPYRHATHAQASAEEAQVRGALDLALRVGEVMLRCGAGAPQTEASIIAIGAAAGLEQLEVDITLQSLLVQCIHEEQPITLLRVVRSSRRDLARLVAVHQYVERIIADGFDLDRARAELRAIRARPRVYPAWLVTLFTGILSAAVAFMLGAGVAAVLLAMVSALAVAKLSTWFTRWRYPVFYRNVVGAFFATAFAWLAYGAGAAGWLPVTSTDFALIVAGGIVVLLPTRELASAVEDVLSGYHVTGAGGMLAVALNLSALVAGVAAGLRATLWLTTALEVSFVSPGVLDLRATAAPVLGGSLGAAIVAASAAITLQGRRSLILPVVGVGVLGFSVASVLAGVVGFGATTSVGLAAVVLGLVGRFVAARLHAPPLAVVVPASFTLLPGLAIFRGLYAIVTSSQEGAGLLSIQSGLVTLLGALATLLVLATGTYFGELLASPLDNLRARRRIRG